jgi:small-conductance mechanosensitive channel
MRLVHRILRHDPMEFVAPLVTFAITFLIAWVVRAVVLRALRAWTGRTQSRLGQVLLDGLRGATVVWALIIAAHMAVQSADLPLWWEHNVPKALNVLWIASLTILCMRMAGSLVRFYGDQVPGALPVTTLTETLAELGILIVGILLSLTALDFRITPILTALGVGGLAVALALQDTLSNLFSGFYVAVARQVRLGDYIKLNTGEEGYVADIGWRSTTIRALANNFILVPNAKLAQAVVTNFHLPEKRMSASVQVTVAYGEEEERVEAVLLDVVRKAVGEVEGILAEPAPNVAFDPGFTDNGLGFSVNYQVVEFAAQFGVRNELRKRILRRLRAEGIEIPFPTRVVYLKEGTKREDGPPRR